jgi:hypothetical protein
VRKDHFGQKPCPKVIEQFVLISYVYWQGDKIMEAIEFGTSAIDGVIEIPAEYQKDFSTGLRVILIKDAEDRGVSESSPVIQERLAAAKRLAGFASKHPFSLEEIRRERLARQ